MTEAELDRVLTLNDFRHNGFCIKGTKAYGESLGFSFRDLLDGKIKVRDLMSYESDAFVKALLQYIFGEQYGR
jgi:hypothetical protein